MIDYARMLFDTAYVWVKFRWLLLVSFSVVMVDVYLFAIDAYDGHPNHIASELFVATIGLALWLIDRKNLHSLYKSYVLEFLPIDFSTITIPEECGSWKLFEVSGVTGKTAAIYSETANERLVEKRISLNIETTRYKIPEIVREFEFFAIYRSRPGIKFNGSTVRMASDLITPIENERLSVTVQRSNFYAGLCTNELASRSIYSKDQLNMAAPGIEKFDGRTLWLERNLPKQSHRILLSLSSPLCSNQIGISTLALTTDGRVPIVKQGAGSAQSAGLNAPSASGSLDWDDIEFEDTLQELIVRGVERELIEECSIKREHIIKTVVVGHARLLHRGGIPEFFCFTLLSKDANFSFRRHAEINYVEAVRQQIAMHHTGNLDFIHAIETLAKLHSDEDPNNSIQLLLNIHFVRNYLIQKVSVPESSPH